MNENSKSFEKLNCLIEREEMKKILRWNFETHES